MSEVLNSRIRPLTLVDLEKAHFATPDLYRKLALLTGRLSKEIPAFTASSKVVKGTGFTFLGLSVDPNSVPKVSKYCLYNTAGEAVVSVFAKTVAGMTVHARKHNINSLLRDIVQISLFH